MSAATEERYNRLNTTAFIAARPTEIVLIPQTRDKTSGGFKYRDELPRDPQIFRANDTVDEPDCEVEAVGVAEHPGEARGRGVARYLGGLL